MNDFDLNSQQSPDEQQVLVYGFASAPGFIPGKAGTAFAALTTGLLKTTDGGQTWHDALVDIPLSEPVPVTSVLVAPDFQRDGRIFAGAPGGVFHSTDQGLSWEILQFPPPPPTVSALASSPDFAKDDFIIAGTMEDGIFVSSEGGRRWVTWNFGLLDLNILCLAVSPYFSQDETIYAGTESGIFYSTNGGRAWREVEMPFGFEPILCLAVSSMDQTGRTVYAGTENHGLWRSIDGGTSWNRLDGSILQDPVNAIHLSSTDPMQLMAVTSQGLWVTSDEGQSWNNILPGSEENFEISSVLAPKGFSRGARILLGLVGGDIKIITI